MMKKNLTLLSPLTLAILGCAFIATVMSTSRKSNKGFETT